jgi:hypothetical protein
MPMGKLSWLVVASVAAFAGHAQAQSIPLTITCNDSTGRSVTGVQVTNGIIARAKFDPDGRPVIEYDPRRIDGISPQLQLFVYAHECGHLALGHLRRGESTTVTQEQAADCFGIRSLMNKVGVTTDDVTILQGAMQRLGGGDARHLPWPARMYDLEACFASQTAGRGSGEVSADDCVLHRDAANAIVNESRDGRTIEGLYSAANKCSREVTCTFTIQTGTLPDADIDVDSWLHFRIQKTRTEQHSLKPAAEVEFRFRETVDDVPVDESVDFRVLQACQ